MLSENGVPVYHDGRLIGTIHRGELQQTRRPNAFMRWGIALDVAVLAEAERAGADRVRIKNAETGEIFTATIAAIRKLGKPIDHGFGAQIVLAFGHWHKTTQRSTQSTQPAHTFTNTERKTAQASLFDLAVTP